MRIVMFFALMIAMFIAGRASVEPEIKVKTEKVYSLPEGMTIQKACSGLYGNKLEEAQNKAKEEIEEFKRESREDIEIWKSGYMQGYRDRREQ